MSCLRFTGIFLTLFLAETALSRLHPECEYIFQLEKEERQCLQYIAKQENKSSEGCQPFWDAVTCWPQAISGETVQRACPAVFSLFKNTTAWENCDLVQERTALITHLKNSSNAGVLQAMVGMNITQSFGDYSSEYIVTEASQGSVSRNCSTEGWSVAFPPYHVACIVEDDIPETEESYFATVKLIYTIGYSISLVVLVVAVLILLLFRRLRCARNFIHIQLFVTFILKSAAVFIKDATLFSNDDTNHCTLSTFVCKAAVVFCHYCVMANFFWLLVEALYLSSLLLSSFYHSRRCLWGFSLLGWGVPVFFIVLWIASRVYFEDTECWDINEDSPYWWIIKGPIVISIAVNFVLFVNILRILIQKLNPRLTQFNNSSQYRRLAKSTLLLIPLFGSHYMLFNFLPDYFNVNLRLCIELCMGSFQGLLVAVLYCFLNHEVQKEVHMQWLRWQERSYGVVSPAAKGSQMDTPF